MNNTPSHLPSNPGDPAADHLVDRTVGAIAASAATTPSPAVGVDEPEVTRIIDLTECGGEVFDPVTLLPLESTESAESAAVAQPRPSKVLSLIALGAAALFVVSIVSNGGGLTLAIAVAFGSMIFLHELGHFMTARLTGMKATEFFVGFGPRIWSFRRGETEYGIKALPLGGYVKILGMTNVEEIADPADEPRTYRQQSYPKRLLVASAGTLMHLILAFVLLVSVYSGFGERQEIEGAIRIRAVTAEINGEPSPASVAGLMSGDTIIEIDGKKVVGPETIAEHLADRAGKPVVLTIGETTNWTARTVTVVPAAVESGGRTIGRIGIEQEPATMSVRSSLAAGSARAVREITNLAPQTFTALGRFFTPEQLKRYTTAVASADDPKATGAIQNERFLSPVGVVQTVEQASGIDFRFGLQLFAFINVFVGVFNMLPMLPFDGGHVVIATYEAIRSRLSRRRYHADVARLVPVTYVVLFVMLAIGLSSLYLDIRSPIKF